MTTGAFDFDVCVIGTGRVGLPLGLSFTEAGLRTVGVDLDRDLRETVNGGHMPFYEPGYDEVVARRTFRVEGDHAVVARSAAVVIAVGTPLLEGIESDLRPLRKVFEAIVPHLRKGQLLCLRSTVSPGTTTLMGQWAARATGLRLGQELRLAYCPERIAEGFAREELHTLPQLVGTEDPDSRAAAEALFDAVAPELLHCDFLHAELAKLFSNLARYLQFALGNHLAMVAEQFGADIHLIRRLANDRYPREKLAPPGLAGGPCLGKDFGMVSEWVAEVDLGLSAWRLNESVPLFLVRRLDLRAPLRDRRVGVLGYAYKADIDDVRETPVSKLVRTVQRRAPAEVRVSDPNLPARIHDPLNGAIENHEAWATAAWSERLFVAMPHRGFRDILVRLGAERPDVWIADVWNVGGIDRMFYQASELAQAANGE